MSSLGIPVAIRDFLVFQLKVVIDGLKDVIIIKTSIVVILIDLLLNLISGGRWKFFLFYGTVSMSKRFERWIKLHATKARGDDPTRPGAGGGRLLGTLRDL